MILYEKEPQANLTFAGADWKDVEGMANSFKSILKKMGKFVYEDPTTGIGLVWLCDF